MGKKSTAEIIRQVRKVEIRTRAMVNDLFSGGYHSVFKGRGMEFAEVREYMPGDDVRTIDWNVTARTGRPHVKIFSEERELTVMFLVDTSSSLLFGSAGQSKLDIAAELCAVLAFSAARNNDKTGCILFGEQVNTVVPPRKGSNHALRIVREVLAANAYGRATDMAGALAYLMRVVRRRGIVFLISDFLCSGHEKQLRLTARKFDLIPVTVNDPREFSLPDIGRIRLTDAESRIDAVIDTSDETIRKRYADRGAKREQELDLLLRSAGLDRIRIMTDMPYIHPLVEFFHKRANRT